MPKKIKTSSLNKKHKKFWREQTHLMKKRMADDVIRGTALNELHDEELRRLPVYFRTSLEKALENAENVRRCFISQQGRKGGRSPKNNSLQKFVGDLIQKNPNISWKSLLGKLEGRTEMSVGVEGEKILFKDSSGKTKSASISGLKDRVYRAKKKMKLNSH